MLALAVGATSALSQEKGRPHLYLLANPIQTDASLGRLAKTLHYGWVLSGTGVGPFLTYQVTGKVSAGVAYFVFGVFRRMPYVTVNTLIHLGIKGKRKSRALRRELRDIPGLTKAMILSTSNIEFSGLAAVRRHSYGYVFVESSRELAASEEWTRTFGEPLEITDPYQAKLRLSLDMAGLPGTATWDVTLADVFAGAPVPGPVASQWREDLKLYDSVQPWLRRHTTRSHHTGVRLTSALVMPDGATRELGTLMPGPKVYRLLGRSLFRRIERLPCETLLVR